MAKDILRRCRFSPYRKGMGPTFSLITWDTGRMQCAVGSSLTHYTLGYKLMMRQPFDGPSVTLFEGEDHGCPLHTAIDSDDAVRSIMGFLTLRPGDTDSEYFESYTPEQLAYAEQHAEALSLEVMNRFGED